MTAFRATGGVGLIGLGLSAILTGCERQTVVPLEVQSVEVVPASFTLVEGESRPADAEVRGPDGVELTGRAVGWSTDTERVASVDGSGTVEGVDEGVTMLRATVEGVTGTAPVTVLSGPRIDLPEGNVSLTAVSGDRSETKVLAVSNGGQGTLDGLTVQTTYPAEAPSGWLTAGLDGTRAPVQLSLSASARELPPGTYAAGVTVRSPAAGGLSADVAVAFEVEAPPPSISLDIGEIAFSAVKGGQAPATQTVAVVNGGGGLLVGLRASVTYPEAERKGWLEAVLAAPVAPTVLTVRASPGNLPPGTYHATVEVASDEVPVAAVEVAVEFTIAPSTPVETAAAPGCPSAANLAAAPRCGTRRPRTP